MYDTNGFGSNLGGFLGGIFGNPQKPYDKNQGYLDKGKQGYQGYQDWLNKQQDAAKFINDTMNQYQESPYAHNMQQQSIRAGQNAASASGLTGSTPFAQQLEQNAGQISSADQNQWLHDVLGINTQYGQGQFNNANAMNDIYGRMGENAYNKETTGQNNMWNTIGNGIGLFGNMFGFGG
jgi:hypothetical protein